MDPVVGVLDIGLGNVASISNAVDSQGVDVVQLTATEDMDHCTHLILPGVGHFSYGIECMKKSGFFRAIPKFIQSGRPVMGVCLGMQLLCSGSDEDKGVAGVDAFDGQFQKFSDDVRVPHMGWNEVTWQQDHPINENIKSGKDFYFVHSYLLKSSSSVLSTTHYHSDYVSSLAKNNVVGFQFHPEKSQKNGLAIIENFCWWDGRC